MSCESDFRPEFLNRLDEIILFKPLTKDNKEKYHSSADGRTESTS
ncbi:MAG: hypothetical protein V8R80_06850 [Eubacterium sp.]